MDFKWYGEAFDEASLQHFDPNVTFDFSPRKLNEHLMHTAAVQGITPAQLQKDLKELIAHHESRNPKSDKILALEKKYNVRVYPDSIDSNTTITYFRLQLMFPQFHRFDLAPIPNGRVEKKCPGLGSDMPQIMRHPEFGGFIPRSLSDDEAALLIAIHCYWLICDSETADPVMILPEQILIRMVFSQLKDKMRIKVLKDNLVLNSTNLTLNGAVSKVCHSTSSCNDVYMKLKDLKPSTYLKKRMNL